MSGNHLVILKKHYIDKAICGLKTIESRLSKTRREYWRKVRTGDKLFLKESSGPIRAVAKVRKVEYFEGLCASKIDGLKRKYNQQIIGDDEYWQSKSDSRYCVLVWLNGVREIKPVRIRKKDWRAWVVLSKKEDFGLFNSKF